ncbi:FabD/lysophospholipase-like protein [Mytilinidion resinicola]|uniref:Lysophospholipase n=1 Tax=Mytilinidion resinicola TaxID=574789 RepID=A0A6A6ZAL8_9PEZI|nr:FabD/lysophospholipase-like protein [Mytilinidion resinicola]KAF2817344.1 FabD/lysophospholipase-like protein [Mytilinidion resinicola]
MLKSSSVRTAGSRRGGRSGPYGLNFTRQRLFTRRAQVPPSGAQALKYTPSVLLASFAVGILSTSIIDLHDLAGSFTRRSLRADSSESNSWTNNIPYIGSWGRGNEDKHESTTVDEADTSQVASGQQEPPPQTRVVSDSGEETTPERLPSSWDGFTGSLTTASKSVTSIGDTIVDFIVPDWFKILPGFLNKLQNELSMAPGSLAEEIWYEANDPEINPEIIWDAVVRVSNDICTEEKAFLEKRRAHTRRAISKYLGVAERDIHPEDVPTIAMCGSGGGLRALVAGSSSYLSAHEAGLFDCVTYTAGVSGSCWLQTLYYSSMTGQSHQKLIDHLKNRLGVHIAFPPAALPLLTCAPTNKYLLSGLVEKSKGIPDADFGIVDIYGLLLAARLLVPKSELSVDEYDFKISNQRRYIDDGSHPLPIYTAVRHEIPLAEQSDMKDPVAVSAKARREAWFQWFEFTPYEFWCEELEAGIPTWAVGRKFENGKTVWRQNGLALPELRVPLLMGIWGSAFCATLSHYYREIRPIMRGLAGFDGIDQLISERDEELIKLHPIDPAGIPNFALGMRDVLPSSCPESIHKTANLQLMDAGMSNNLPIYPLLRPGREVDILIAFDASADVKTDNWLKVADGYARQRGIKGWPIGAGWPPSDASQQEIAEDLEAAQAKSDEDANAKMDEAKRVQRRQEAKKHATVNEELGYCNVWVGTTEERTSDSEPPSSKRVEEDWELLQPNAGITVVYFPFVSNPKVNGVDPKKSDFMSTWNFVYTPDQIDSVVSLARTNFQEGEEQTRRTVRAVYERKRAKRLEREAEEKRHRRQWKLRRGTVGRKLGEGDHGDHFS